MGWVRFTPSVTKGGLVVGAVALLSLSACNDLGEDATTYSVPGDGIFAGDVDGDGDVDLVTGGGDVSTVLMNDGTGTFTSTVVDGHVDFSHMMLMDVNGDTKQDMAMLTYNPGDPPTVPADWHLETRLSNGDGTFDDATVVGSTALAEGEHPAIAVISADMNADGHADVVAYRSSEGHPGAAVVFPWTGPNSFGPAVVSPSSSAVLTEGHLNHASTAAADVTGDGKRDLVIAGWGAWPGDPYSRGQIAVMAGNGAGGFTSTAAYAAIEGNSSRAIGPGIGDFNQDGRLDVVAADTRVVSGPETLTFWFGTPGGTLGSPVSRDGRGEQDTDLVVADFDQDAHLDIVTIARLFSDDLQGAGWLLKGDGTGNIASTSELGAKVPHDFEHGGIIPRDFDGDGVVDLAIGDGAGTVTVYRNRLTAG
jgi:hypothetical protein